MYQAYATLELFTFAFSRIFGWVVGFHCYQSEICVHILDVLNSNYLIFPIGSARKKPEFDLCFAIFSNNQCQIPTFSGVSERENDEPKASTGHNFLKL